MPAKPDLLHTEDGLALFLAECCGERWEDLGLPRRAQLRLYASCALSAAMETRDAELG